MQWLVAKPICTSKLEEYCYKDYILPVTRIHVTVQCNAHPHSSKKCALENTAAIWDFGKAQKIYIAQFKKPIFSASLSTLVGVKVTIKREPLIFSAAAAAGWPQTAHLRSVKATALSPWQPARGLNFTGLFLRVRLTLDVVFRCYDHYRPRKVIKWSSPSVHLCPLYCNHCRLSEKPTETGEIFSQQIKECFTT